MSADVLWYYLEKSGAQSSPVTKEDLLSRLRSGALSADDLVWTEGMADWAPLRTAIDLAAIRPTAPPPIPNAMRESAQPAVPTQKSGKRTPIEFVEIILSVIGSVYVGLIIGELVWGMRVHDFSNKPILTWIIVVAVLLGGSYLLRDRRLRSGGAAPDFGSRHGKWMKNVAAGVVATAVLFTATCWSQMNEDIWLRSQEYGPKSSGGSSPFVASSQHGSALKAELRNLATAEEVFWADSSRYTSALPHLSFTPEPGTSVRITGATDTGWAAVAVYDNDPSKGCAISSFTGSEKIDAATPKGVHPTVNSEPVCDEGI